MRTQGYHFIYENQYISYIPRIKIFYKLYCILSYVL